jgi:hypothetical protein
VQQLTQHPVCTSTVSREVRGRVLELLETLQQKSFSE